ncbi:MAG: transglutaminase-like domain-containing protein [Pseudomonadota bacterium]
MEIRLRSAQRGFSYVITASVLAVFLLLTGTAARDKYFTSFGETSSPIRFSEAEADDWFVIRIRGAYSGFGRSRQYRTGDGWTLRDDLNLSLNIQGQLKPVKIESAADVDGEFRLKSFKLRISSGIVSFDQTGRMDGRDLVLDVPKAQGGGVRRMKLFEAPRMSRSLGLPVPLTGLQVGDEMKFPVFDPFEGAKSDAIIKVVQKADMEVSGRKTEAWLVKALFRNADVGMWVDKEGRLLKGRLPLDITVIRSDKDEIARLVSGPKNLPDIVMLSNVSTDRPIPNPRNLTKLKLAVTRGGNLDIAEDTFRQKSSDLKVVVTKEQLPKASYVLPCKDAKVAQFLVSSRFIVSDHTEVIDKAKEIVGNEKDPVKAAQLINEWVYKNLKKVPVPTVPDALTVLRTRHGDCNEHAVLAVALARAVGLPARMALGLVYQDDGFYYHAWVTYWSGTDWFTGDPLMNQLPVDASHVTLLYGDVEKHLNVISYLGQLEFKIEEMQ